MITTAEGVTAATRISHGMALQINSVKSELVKVALLRRDLWLTQIVTNITTRTPKTTVVNSPRIIAVIHHYPLRTVRFS
jgi:hypothetical protein